MSPFCLSLSPSPFFSPGLSAHRLPVRVGHDQAPGLSAIGAHGLAWHLFNLKLVGAALGCINACVRVLFGTKKRLPDVGRFS